MDEMDTETNEELVDVMVRFGTGLEVGPFVLGSEGLALFNAHHSFLLQIDFVTDDRHGPLHMHTLILSQVKDILNGRGMRTSGSSSLMRMMC